MNKIILSVILLLVIILSFCACSSGDIDKNTTTTETTEAESIIEATEEVTTVPIETTTRNPIYDDPMYEGLTDEEKELIIGTFGEDFKFEGVDELSSKEISKLLKYARSVGKRVKIRNSKLVISDVEDSGSTVKSTTSATTAKVTTTVRATAPATTEVTTKVKATEPPEETTTGTAWQDNALLKLLPALQFGRITLQSGNDKEYAITVTDFTKSNIDDYETLLASAGFSHGIEQIDDEENGVYSYSASKMDGTAVNLSMVTPDCLVITVKIPQDQD